MDAIWIKGIECRCRVGVPDLERRRPQKIVVDIKLSLDLRRAGRSDDFKDTADYWAIERRVREIAQAGEYRLLERLAEAVAQAVLKLDRKAARVAVWAHKTPAVMPKTREVAVEISRERR